jgi:hypothetical protein
MGNRDNKPNFGIEALNPENPHNGMSVAKSHCHCAQVKVVPACLGDPELYLCADCMQFCEKVWLPIWGKVGRGTYRKHKWDMASMIKNMEWIKLDSSNRPEFEERVFLAMFLEEDGDHEDRTTELFTVGKLMGIDKKGFRFESEHGSGDTVPATRF